MTPPTPAPQWQWKQPEAVRRYHELSIDNQRVATLNFDKNWGGSLATAACEFGVWTLKRNGFLSPRITLRAQGAETDLAVFEPKWTGGGMLRFAAGRAYELKSLSMWGGDWAFVDERGAHLLTLHGPHGMVRNSGEITADLAAADAPTLYLLAIIAWYVNLLMAEDAAACAGASAACM